MKIKRKTIFSTCLISIVILFPCCACVIASSIGFIYYLRQHSYEIFDFDETVFPIYSEEIQIDSDLKIVWTAQSTHPLFGEPIHRVTVYYKGKEKEFIYNRPPYRNLNIYYNSDPNNPYIRYENQSSFIINLSTMEEEYVAVGDDKVFSLKSGSEYSSKLIQCLEGNKGNEYFIVSNYASEETKKVIPINTSEEFVGSIDWSDGISELKFYSKTEKPKEELISESENSFYGCGEEF